MTTIRHRPRDAGLIGKRASPDLTDTDQQLKVWHRASAEVSIECACHCHVRLLNQRDAEGKTE